MSQSLKTTKGKKVFLNRAYKSTPDYSPPSRFRVGINQTEVTSETTSLVRQVPISGTESVDSCDSTTGWSAGTDSAVSLNSSTYKEGSGALNIYKSGTSGTTFGASKTTTSRDFTSKDLHTWLYVADVDDLVSSGTAVTVRFGSDSSNYYYYEVDVSDLSDGWNLIVWSSSDASGTTGSPVITACDYYEILLSVDSASDTVAEGDCVIDDLKLASSDDYYKSFESGYPLVDESNLTVSMRGYLLATEANGYLINGFLEENSDSSVMQTGADNFTGESKSTSDEIVFDVVDWVI